MLLQLENTNEANLKKLLEYARELKLNLQLLDQDTGKNALPGKPLSAIALRALIENSRKTGVITMAAAHETIRKNFHAD